MAISKVAQPCIGRPNSVLSEIDMTAKKKKYKKPVKKNLKKGLRKPDKKKNKINYPLLFSFIVLLVCVSISVYFRILLVDMPLDRDEGTYLYLGKLLLQGETPYVDFYEMKPPAIFYTYAIFHLIFGSSMVGLHVGLLLMNLLTGFFIFKLANELFKDLISGILAAGIYLLLSINIWTFGFGVMSEHFVVLFSIIGLYMLFKGLSKKSNLILFWSGFLLSWSFLIKQHGAFFIISAFIPFLYYFYKSRLKMVRPFLFWAIGGFLPAILLSLNLWIQGAFDDMVYWIYERPSSRYMQSISWETGKRMLNSWWNNITRDQQFYWFLAPAGLILYSIANKLNWKTFFIWVFSIFSIGMIFPGFRFYGHYWILLLPATAIACALFYHSLQRLIPARLKQVSIYTVLLIFLVGTLYSSFKIKDLYISRTSDQVSQTVYGDNPFVQLKKLSDYLSSQLADDDDIYVLGSEPQVYYYLGKNSQIKHSYIGYSNKAHPDSRAMQQEIIDYLRNDPPEYLVHVQHVYSWGLRPESSDDLYKYAHYIKDQKYFPIAYADIINRYNTNYIYGQEALNYNPNSDKYVVVLKRKDINGK